MASPQQPVPPQPPAVPVGSGHDHHRQLSADDVARLQAEVEFQLEHAGHESAHQKMALILVGALIASQLIFFMWKRLHNRSFHAATLLGLWLVPAGMAMQAGNVRFVTIWVIYSILNAAVVYQAMQVPVKPWTPRLVYKWFAVVYNACHSVGMLGYAFCLLSFFHVPLILHISSIEDEAKLFEAGIVLAFYGLYFAVCARDLVVLLGDRMAVNVGYHSKEGFPAKHLRSNTCAICGDSTDLVEPDKRHKQNCGHTFHENCIRGYAIIGKKDACPYCKEKIDTSQFRTNPWDTSIGAYLALLDAARYLLVWNPIAFLLVHVVFQLFGLK
ncbi:hypothetical protein HDU89_004262 [Geranomyces variabilis]|nr:hypothetical protein BDZ88DRAFT_449568 [Geranomyces variabilis]KAJ3142214.1 hypothetical protein HDU90_004487 [Geranomyces variabilis]KAJ3156480.1 hypothetical protein HDU89_004262 [Geranomyces variabilis]